MVTGNTSVTSLIARFVGTVAGRVHFDGFGEVHLIDGGIANQIPSDYKTAPNTRMGITERANERTRKLVQVKARMQLLNQLLVICVAILSVSAVYEWRDGKERMRAVETTDLKNKFLVTLMERLVPTRPVNVRIETKGEEAEPALTKKLGNYVQVLLLHSFDSPNGEEPAYLDIIQEPEEGPNTGNSILYDENGESTGKSLKEYFEFVTDKFRSPVPKSILDYDFTSVEDFMAEYVPNWQELKSQIKSSSNAEPNTNYDEDGSIGGEQGKLNSSLIEKDTGKSSEETDSAYNTFNQTKNESAISDSSLLSDDSNNSNLKNDESKPSPTQLNDSEKEKSSSILDSLTALRNETKQMANKIGDHLLLEDSLRRLNRKIREDDNKHTVIFKKIFEIGKRAPLEDILLPLLEFQAMYIYQKTLPEGQDPRDRNFFILELANPKHYRDCTGLDNLLQSYLNENNDDRNFPKNKKEFLDQCFYTNNTSEKLIQYYEQLVEKIIHMKYVSQSKMHLSDLYHGEIVEGLAEFWSFETYRSKCASLINQLTGDKETIDEFLNKAAIPVIEPEVENYDGSENITDKRSNIVSTQGRFN